MNNHKMDLVYLLAFIQIIQTIRIRFKSTTQTSVVMSYEGLALSDIYNEYMDETRRRSRKRNIVVTIFKNLNI